MALTAQYFNEKYKSHIVDGHYGLQIGHRRVIEYLDSVFSRLENFKISQIKLKFGVPCVYLDSDQEGLNYLLEADISNIMEYYNNPYPERVFNK